MSDINYLRNGGLGEEQVIKEFYGYPRDIMKSANFLVIIGYNILRFDIPLLIRKGVYYNVDNIENLNKLWHEIFVVDLFQVTLPLNNMRFKGHELESLAKKAREYDLQIPDPHGSGKDIQKWYTEKNYEEIEKHIKKDLEMIRALDLQITKLIKSCIR